MKRGPTRRFKSSRRGSIYAIVMFSSVLVAALGIGALQVLRVQGKQFAESNDFAQARIYARTAIDVAMVRISYDAYWRTHFGNGVWSTNQPIGTGTYSLSAVDPVDGDITVGKNDPIIVTATGKKGQASFTTSVRLEIGPPQGSVLEVSMTSDNDTVVSGATLASDQTVASNNNYNGGGGAVINANVEYFKGLQGSGYAKATKKVKTARPMPDPQHALDYYTAGGTVINYTSLPQFQPVEMTTNPKFETNITGWYNSGACTLQQSSAQFKEGVYSLLVKSRGNTASVAAQDLVASSLAQLQSGHTYNLKIPIYIATTCTASAVLIVTDSDGGAVTYASPAQNIAPDGLNNYHWTDLQGNFTPTWTGTLTQATIEISISSKNNYYMDAVTMTDISYPNNAYVFKNTLLSPSSNPYGATNAQGIYILVCGNQPVIISNSRIVGTLVIQNGKNCIIQDSVLMEPAVPQYPSLLADANSKLTIGFSATPLGEGAIGVNLNPPGTPYPYLSGTTNTTLVDSYPSKIVGLVYAASDLTFQSTPTIASGVVVCDGQIKVNATSLTLTYSNEFLNNPPPGFSAGTPTISTVPGTWQRIVN